ncbi:MAG: ATP synthase subunit I [Thiotrichales bacterium]
MHHRLFLTQFILVALVVGVSGYYHQLDGVLAGLYGGAVALINSYWLNRRIVQAGVLAKDDPKQGVYALYFGAMQRFVFALVMLGVGLGALHLDAIPLLASFAVAQLAYLISGKAAIGV